MVIIDGVEVPPPLINDALHYLHRGHHEVFAWFLLRGHLCTQTALPRRALLTASLEMGMHYETVVRNTEELVALGALISRGEGRGRSYYVDLAWRCRGPHP